MLKKLLDRFYIEEYVPHVRHTLYAVLFMSAGYVCVLDYDWIFFGWTLFWLGFALYVVIAFGIAWRGPIEYWRQIEETIKVMLKINSPEIWHALGFKEVPKTTVQVMEHIDNGQGFTTTKIKQLTTNSIMLNTISNKVLLSGKTDFTEERFKKIVKNFRKTKDEFIGKGYITKSTSHPKSPYVFTRKGMDEIVYQYADQAIILQVRKEQNAKTN